MIHRIGPVGLEAKAQELLGVKPKHAALPFSDFLKNAVVDQVATTNDFIQKANQKGMDFALGKVDNVAEVMAAQEIANASLQFTVQLRNSFLEAYNEIMRLQV